MKDTPKFFVTIPVKPYVRRFLELNYGAPVNFTGDIVTYKFLRDLLKKPNMRFHTKYPENNCTYSTEVEVVISEDDFYRYGFELTKPDIVTFGKHFEDRAKVMMRSMVGVYNGIGLPIRDSIWKFQTRFGFEEETWNFDSIKKDFYRNGINGKIDFNNEIFAKIEKIILVNLSVLGTVSQRVIRQYESSNKAG